MDTGGPIYVPHHFDRRRCPGCEGWLNNHHFGCPLVKSWNEDISHLKAHEISALLAEKRK